MSEQLEETEKNGELQEENTLSETEEQDDSMTDDPESYPVGIGGWLILPVINLILSGIISFIFIVALPFKLSTNLDSGSLVLSWVELLGRVLYMYILIKAAVLFFQKKASAPSWMINIIYANIVFYALMTVVAISVGDSGQASEMGIDLLCGLFYGAIWIQYFKISKRVKATFVN
jgi:hypothetical protein